MLFDLCCGSEMKATCNMGGQSIRIYEEGNQNSERTIMGRGSVWIGSKGNSLLWAVATLTGNCKKKMSEQKIDICHHPLQGTLQDDENKK